MLKIPRVRTGYFVSTHPHPDLFPKGEGENWPI